MINTARLCQFIVEQDLLGLVTLPFNIVDSTPRRDILPTLRYVESIRLMSPIKLHASKC